MILVGASMGFTAIALLLQDIGAIPLLLVLLGLAWLLTETLSRWERRRNRQTQTNEQR